jgi:uncharacterized protein YndB with AHSA1/START domain
MNPAAVSGDAIVQEVAIRAPAQKIFAALTSPDELLKWWAAEGKFHATHVETDPRPGGKWFMRVASDRGDKASTTTVWGEYRTVEPPNLLVFTWIRDEKDHPETLVCWNLEEQGGITTVRLTHSGLNSDRLRTLNGGWPLVVRLLQSYIEKQS